MKKIIKNVGNSLGIIFNKEEQKAYKIKKGKIFDINIKEDKGKKKK